MPFRTDKVLAREIGNRIHVLRLEQGLTMEVLAKGSEVSKPYLSLVEAGKRLPTLPVVFALANRLRVHAVDIVGFDIRERRLHALDQSRRRPMPPTSAK